MAPNRAFESGEPAGSPEAQTAGSAGGGSPISWPDVVNGALHASRFDPEGIIEKRARRWADEHILHHHAKDNPITHVAKAEQLEDKGDLSGAQKEFAEAIRTADALNAKKAGKSLNGTRKDEAKETNVYESVKQQETNEEIRKTIVELPIVIRYQAANFYAFHGNKQQAEALIAEAQDKARQLPPSIQRHLQISDFTK